MRAGFACIALAVGVLAVVPAVGAQCPMCRTALEASQEGQALAVKLNHGILVLLAAPFGVAALVGATLHRSRRRRRIAALPATFHLKVPFP
jgi:hypothetical protein